MNEERLLKITAAAFVLVCGVVWVGCRRAGGGSVPVAPPLLVSSSPCPPCIQLPPAVVISTVIVTVQPSTPTAMGLRESYIDGCALRVILKIDPAGLIADQRLSGYYEAFEVIYHSTMTAEAKDAALDTLVASPIFDQYMNYKEIEEDAP